MTRIRSAAPLAALALGALVACGGPQTPAATASFCQSLTQLNTAIGTASSVNASTTVNQAKEAANNVQKAWDDTKKAAANLQSARVNDLQQAYDNFRKTVDSVPGSATLGDSATQVASAASTFRTTAQATMRDVNCR